VSIIRVIDDHAARRPEATALRFLDGDADRPEELTYAALIQRIGGFAERLASDGLTGERVVIACKPGLDYVVAVLGCFAAGATAVPCVPPRPRILKSFTGIIADCSAKAIVVEDDLLANSDLRVFVDRARPRLYRPTDTRASGRYPVVDRNDLAYLQYTSGSTSQPKGVTISHDNLLANVGMIADIYALGPGDGSVSWLPLHHDMGLVAAIMAPLFVGAEATFMAPMSFVQDPLHWIRAISRYRARMAGGPSFSFGLCVQAFDANRLRGVDLSCWTLALNGAESVSVETMSAFADRYREFGFRRAAFKPSYGLAEATLLVSTVAHDVEATVSIGPDDKHRAVVGHPVTPCAVRLLGEDGALFDNAGQIGEICIAGPSLTQGYWGKPPTALATIAQDGVAWLRTGDLGYFDRDGLVICGRLKETIIVQGRNFYPADIEEAALIGAGQDHVRAAAAIAIDAADGEEAGLIVELQRNVSPELYPHIAAELMKAVREGLELDLGRLLFVRPAALPRTTSGKIQRLACRDAVRNGTLPVAWQHERARPRRGGAQVASFEAAVEAVIGRTLAPDDWDRSLIDLGIDSMGIGRLSATLIRSCGYCISHKLLHTAASLREVSNQLSRSTPGQFRRDVGDSLPLSKNQLALLLMQSRFPDSSRFSVARALRVIEGGALQSVERLREALEAIPTARARLASRNARPVIIFASADVTERHFASAALAREWVASRCAAPWQLEQDALVQVELLRSPEESLLLCRAHHLVCDIHSLQLLMEVLLAASGDRPIPRASGVPGQLLVRDAEWDTPAEVERATTALSEALAPPYEYANLRRLPFLPMEVQTGRIGFEVSKRDADRLSALFRANSATDFVGLAALFMAALAHSLPVADVLIATAVDTRETQEDQETIDNYANLSLLRGTVQEGESFRDFLARLRVYVEKTAGIRALPFSDLVGHLNPARNADALPLTEILFLTHRAASEGAADLILGRDGQQFKQLGMRVAPVECRVGDPAFDLRADVVATSNGLKAQIEYRKGVLSDALVESVAHAFTALVERICDAPDAALDWTPRPTPELFGEVLAPATVGLVPEILSVAAQSHDQIAVTDAAGEYRYTELVARSAAVANAIASRGIDPGSAIAVCLPRRFDLVAALLGIWRAGCCFVPIPMNTPLERRRRLVELGDARVLVDSEFMQHVVPGEAPPRVPPATAFRLFTSGTTGVPKGVEVTMAGLENLLQAMQRLVPLSASDRVVASSSIGFDIAEMEVWAVLRAGGRIVMVDTEDLLDGRAFQNLLDRYGATVMQATPSGYSNLIASGWRGGSQLRLLCAGERLEWELADELMSRSAGLWNLYGPTETTIYATGGRVDRALSRVHPNGVPIGDPVANTSVLILGTDLRPVPQGAVGELCIAGAGLGAGYFGDPGLTEAKFVTLEAAGHAKRIYRSGDRVRLTPEGMLEYLGRADRQVKVRGHRLDLGEVEALLRELPCVLSAHAMAFTGSDGGVEVRAALVSAWDQPPADHEIRKSLREFAPSYAIPSRLCWIPELPVNANGKVEIEIVRSFLEATAEPVTQIPEAPDRLERTILQIWSEVLGCVVTDGSTTFFDAGGTSLQLLDVRRLLLDRTGIDFSVPELLQFGGAREFARAIKSRSQPDPAAPRTDREQISRRRRERLAGKTSG
jgi:amino acid adenylation domain-containing protein